MGDLPGPGLEPESPALAGRFLTTAPPYFIFKSNLRSQLNAQDGGKKCFFVCLFSSIFFVTWMWQFDERKVLPFLVPREVRAHCWGLLWVLTLAVASHGWRRQLINFTAVLNFHNEVTVCQGSVFKTGSLLLTHTVIGPFKSLSQFLKTQ